MTKCCAPNCPNDVRKDALEYSFHEFPNDPLVRSQWISNIGRSNWNPGRRSILCSAHFENHFFIKKGKKTCLSNEAVPTRFFPLKKRANCYPSRISTIAATRNSLCERGIEEPSVVKQDFSSASGESIKTIQTASEVKHTDEEDFHSHLIQISMSSPVKNDNEVIPKISDAENLIENFVLIDGKYVFEDGQLLEKAIENQNSSSFQGTVVKNNNYSSIVSHNVFDRQNQPVVGPTNAELGLVEDSFACGNVIIVKSTNNSYTDILSFDGASEESHNNVICVQQSSGELNTQFKQSLNILDIATPCSASISDTSDSFLSLMGNDLAPCTKSETFSEQTFEKYRSQNFPSSGFSVSTINDYAGKSKISEEASGFKAHSPTFNLEKQNLSFPHLFENHVFSDQATKVQDSTLNWQKGTFMCRLCGVASSKTVNLFSAEALKQKVLERIRSFLPLRINQCDELPQNVCSDCLCRLDTCSELFVSAFNTHRKLLSVLGQNVEEHITMPAYFHKPELKTEKGSKRHMLLLELFHDESRPVEECIVQAYEDLGRRVQPKSIDDKEPQCDLVLFALSDDRSVSHIEQVRVAAEALLSKKSITAIVPHRDISDQNTCKDNIRNSFQNITDFEQDSDEVMQQLTFVKKNTYEEMPFVEIDDSIELDFSEAQAMPITDDVSPYDFSPAEIRCPKIVGSWRGKGIAIKNLQKIFYWKDSNYDKVNLVCRLCQNIFGVQNNTRNHLKEHEELSCHLCGTLLTLNQESAVHKCCESSMLVQQSHCQRGKNFLWKKSSSPWFQCSFCKVRLKSKLSLEQHLQQHYAANAKCKGCGYEALDICEAARHHQTCAQVKLEKDWQCRTCLLICASEDELQRHLVSSGHNDKAKLWLCDICGKKFQKSSKLSQHKKIHLPPDFKFLHQCPHCPKSYIIASRLKEHMQKHDEKKHMCKVCGKLFSTKQILRQHESTHGDPRFVCSECSRTFFRKSHLLKHMKVHAPGNSKTLPSGSLPHRDGLNRCRECKRVFDPKDLLDHYKTSHPHINLDNYVCDLCKEENTSYAQLFQHQREAHKTGVKDCPFCERTIDSSTQMKYHLMRHEGMFPYNCPLCSNGYTANSILQDHIRRKHTGEKPFECKQCFKRFPTSGALAQHSSVHSLPHQLLPCPVCNQGFKRKAHLEVHLRTHTGEKPYPCPICDRPFRQRPDCLKHIRVIHGEDPSKFNIQFHPNMCITFSEAVSVADMELVLESEDLMEEAVEVNPLNISCHEENNCEPGSFQNVPF